jgi:hypothetical protein
MAAELTSAGMVAPVRESLTRTATDIHKKRTVYFPPGWSQRQPWRVVDEITLFVVLFQQRGVTRQPKLHQKVVQCPKQPDLGTEKAVVYLRR